MCRIIQKYKLTYWRNCRGKISLNRSNTRDSRFIMAVLRKKNTSEGDGIEL